MLMVGVLSLGIVWGWVGALRVRRSYSWGIWFWDRIWCSLSLSPAGSRMPRGAVYLRCRHQGWIRLAERSPIGT